MRVIIILLSFFSIVFADIGKVSTVVGDAHIQRANKIIVIKTGLILEEKDIVKTAKNSKVQLIFKDNTVITVGKNSALSINEYLYDIKNSKNSKTDFNFFKGAFKTITGKIGKINKKKFKLRTKTASIGIRGTIIIGNQNMIACTQGGITVKGAGISVDVEANELTIIQKDNAPSQAKTITKQDIKDLKQSLEPATQLTSNETNREKVKEKENKEEKIEKEESTHKKSSVEKTPKSEEIVQQTNKQVNNIVDDTEAQKQTQLTQAQVQVAYDKLISQAQQASLQAQAEQAKTNKAKIDTSNILDTLPSTEDMITLQNQVSNVDTTTQASLNSAISSLNNASSLESIDENAKTEVINSSVTANTSTSQALQDANSFQINTDGIYNTRLNEAQVKAIEAQTAYENAITQANIAQDALNQAQKSGAPSNVISSIQSGVEKANSAVASAHIIANEAQSAVNNLRVTINNTAGQIVTNAQTAVNNATILTQLSLLLNSLEDTKQASLDTSAANDSVQAAKIEIQTASNDATTASNELLSVKQTIISEKNNAISTSNDSISASNTAVNNETSNVQVAYSAKIAKDKANQAKTIANQAMANAVISANKLAAAQTAVTQMNNQLEAAQNALNLAQQNLIDTQTALNSAQGIESNINSSNTSAKVAAQNAVTKAQASYNSALNAKIAAQTAVDTAQTIVDNLDAETLLSTLTIANSEAQSDATIADNTANNAQTSSQTAISAAKIASSDVKAVILSKTNKKSLESNGNKNTLDNSLETFVLSEVKTNEQLIGNSFGGYIGSTELGVFKENENDLNPLFHVQADNLQEFFVGYSSSSNPIKSLVVYGNESTHNYDTNKIYMYKSFKNLKVENNTGNFSTKTTIHYYNPSLNSYTSLSKNFFMEGANRFVVGDGVNIKTINNSFILGGDVFIDNIDSTSGTGSYSILGKQAQGLSQNITNINPDSSHNSEELSASFLNGKKSTDSSSINKHMTGDVFLISYEPGITGKRAENLTIDISDEGEDISAIAKYGNGSTIMSFDGSIENLSAYYINSDIFGVEASNLNAGENGFLIAVPDGAYDNGKFTIYDENDNPLTSNDDSSWGYWTGKNSFTITQRASVSPHSVWVAGIETDSSIIQGLIERELAPGESEVVTFHGKVLGVVDTVNPILMDDSNKVVLNFNLGAARANNMDGTMQFKSVNNASFNLNIDTANSTVNNTKFYGKFSGTAVDSSINHFSGKYYGDGELKSVGGIISVIQNNKNATGVFKATKQ